ncbi:unnamed protein product [Nyctereutes procyonoides]|uniref:(raccoon dog) hypothetical protein n=1 Tax=Nyctereutes procyonoides TaxID=34880 RepID=A0A811ZGZ8_NYCPR|nr:unnamed protein product [Nyctereutes procyonoides]
MDHLRGATRGLHRSQTFAPVLPLFQFNLSQWPRLSHPCLTLVKSHGLSRYLFKYYFFWIGIGISTIGSFNFTTRFPASLVSRWPIMGHLNLQNCVTIWKKIQFLPCTSY